MPIYEYRCPEGHLVELLQGFDGVAPAACAVCGAGPLERTFHSVSVRFKGKGFYSTDYGRSRGDSRKDGNGGKPPAEKAPKQAAEKTPKKTSGSD